MHTCVQCAFIAIVPRLVDHAHYSRYGNPLLIYMYVSTTQCNARNKLVFKKPHRTVGLD